MNSLIDMLRYRAVQRPDALALIAGTSELTYEKLDRQSDLAAQRLRAAGVRSGDLIGLLVARNAETVMWMLAIMKCGAAYIPIDPEYPSKRVQFILHDCQAPYIVGNSSLARTAGLRGQRLLNEDLLIEDVAPDASAGGPELSTPGADQLAYVIYTSGSTGLPKGCLITHGNVLAMLSAALPLFSFRSTDRWSLFHSMCFDFSVWELWGAWATGATAVAVPQQVASSPGEFVDFLISQRITVLNMVPSVFRYMAREHARRGFPGIKVRQLILGGESINLADVKAFADGYGSAAPEFVNMYGITENTVHSTFKKLDPEALSSGFSSPIGRPLPHVSAYILDDKRCPVADGRAGDLWLSGPSLSQGYLARDDITRERFVELSPGHSGAATTRCYRTGDVVRRLPNGELEYLGREDDQVKIFGFRIELGEIEAVLNSHGAVTNSAAATVVTRAGPTLVACIVCAAPYSDELENSINEHLAASLPGYMVPRLLQPVAHVPLMPSGKRDLNAIARLFS